jgi:hypothetical protein
MCSSDSPQKPNEDLELIAKQDGAFPVGDHKFVKANDEPIYLPHFDLGVPQDGFFKKSMNHLYEERLFSKKLAEVTKHFCSMAV